MSDNIIETLINCYEALSDQTGSHIKEAEETLIQIYNEPSSFQELVQLITMDETDEKYKRHAIVGIGKMFNRFYKDSSLEDQASIYNSLLTLLIYPESKFVRDYVLQSVIDGFNAEFIQTAYNFVNEQQENLTEIGIEASLNILALVLPYLQDSEELASISFPLIEKGLNSEGYSVRGAAIQYGLYLANLMENEELINQYINYGLQLITSIATSNDESSFKLLQDLIKAFNVCLDQQDEDEGRIDPNPILESCLSIMSNQEVTYPFSSQVQNLSDCLIINYINQFSTNPEIIKSILQVYFQYAQLFFNPSEPCFDLTEHNIFSSIGVEFSNYPEILDFMWTNVIVSISSTHEGLFASIVALIYSLYGGRDYYQNKISELSELFIHGLEEEAICTNEASARAISELASSQKKQIKSVLDSLVRALLTKLQTNQDVEFIESLTNIAKYTEDIGPIFSDIFNVLTALLQVENLYFQSSVLECLSELVYHSQKQARHFFQQISELCFQIISSTDSLDDFKTKSIKILSFLMESSPKLFAQYAPDFHQYVVQSMESDDLQILKESIRAYGHLLQNFSDQIESSIPTVLPKLKNFASRDISGRQETDNEIFTGKTDPDYGDFDSKVEPIIDVVTQSIRVITKAMSIYPQLLEENLEEIINIIESQLRTGDSDCEFGCAEGCNNLIECILNGGINEQNQEVIAKIASLLTQICESEAGPDVAGAAFTGISDIIASDKTKGIECCNNYLPSILQSIEKIFNGEMLYLTDKPSYIEELHQPAMRVVREIIAAMENESINVIGNLVPTFNRYVDDKSADMKDLILQFYGDLVYGATEAVDDDLKRNTFILATDAIEKRSSPIGFGCIKQLAVKTPQLVSENLEAILGIIKTQLEIREDPPTEALQSIQDNAESALAMIAMHILNDQFPLADFLQVALSRMPAQLELEENNDHIDFYFWLYEMAENADMLKDNLPSFAAVPVRLFSDPIDELPDNYVSSENIQRMLQKLKEISTYIDSEEFKNFVNEVCGNDDFKIESVFEALER